AAALPTVKTIKYGISKIVAEIKDIRDDNYDYKKNPRTTKRNAYKFGLLNGTALGIETAVIVPQLLEAINTRPEVRALYEISDSDVKIAIYGGAGLICLLGNTYFAAKNSVLRSFKRNALGNVAGLGLGALAAATTFAATEITPMIINDQIERKTWFGDFVETMSQGTTEYDINQDPNLIFE
ncbi:MAG: hypothetical protein AB8B83_07040, partial [Bdellovibrionales bacterium]